MEIVNIRLMSSILFMPVNVIVTLPESLTENGEKRKVLWLLHGARVTAGHPYRTGILMMR